MDKDYEKLADIARKASELAYAPYSECYVGACVLCADGKIYTGCNIENASFSATVCAERAAIFKAVSEGERDFSAIAVAGGKKDSEKGFMPCFVCRQVMTEFCSENTDIIVADREGYRVYKFSDLVPFGFSKSDMTD